MLLYQHVAGELLSKAVDMTVTRIRAKGVTVMGLSDTKIRNAKTGRLSDGQGLYLLVKSKGKGWWRFDYRINGKRKCLSMGTYPDVSLSAARDKRAEARKLVAQNIDPSEQRKKEKQARTGADTFESVARLWVTAQAADWSDGHAKRVLGRLEKDVFPVIGSKPAGEVTAADMIALVRRIEARGATYTANRARRDCSKVFGFAIAHGDAERDPAADIKGAMSATKTKHFASITDPKAVGGLLRAIDGFDGHFVTKCALQLAPLVFVRPGELRSAEWSEIDFEKAEWRIPADKMKSRRVHIVPLSTQAIGILQELHKLTGQGRYLFPSVRTDSRPMSENTLNAALRRLGYTKDEMTAHGFRSMASTLLNEQGYNFDWIERQLAHAEKNSVRAAYNYADYLQERKQMMQEWGCLLDQLK